MIQKVFWKLSRNKVNSLRHKLFNVGGRQKKGKINGVNKIE
jgi:hypothetical protein